jgi:ABC-type nitrate/sulfonate/bicarbonate transport system ATPase subunit
VNEKDRDRDRDKVVLYDTRKGFRAGQCVRLLEKSGCGTLTALYHASADVQTDAGPIITVKYTQIGKL